MEMQNGYDVDHPRDTTIDFFQKGSVIFGSNYERVQELKRKYDPENLFNKSHVQL